MRDPDAQLDPSLAQAPAQEVSPPAQRHGFDAGTWAIYGYGSATVGSDQGEVYEAHVGVSWYFIDNLSINFGGFGGYVNGDGDDNGSSLGMELLLRWHFLRRESGSLYLDGGSGIIWTEDPFPDGGTHQNFTPQTGIGTTARIDENLHLIGGVRWYHISNASKSGLDRNPGYNAAQLYVGVMVPF